MSFLFNDLFGGGMPGGGGGHHHHFHGHGMPGQDDEDEEPVDTESFYKLLGIEKNATQNEIKKAYRKKAKTLHPDRHPDEHEKYQSLFQEVQKAHEILKDPQKRSLYDKYGEKGVKRGGGAGGHGSIFEQMFGGGGGGRHEQHSGPKKSPTIKSVLDVTLEDIYRGSKKKIKIPRRVAGSDSATCSKCHGQGQITQIQRMGPMVLQQRRECPLCGGIGYKLEREEHELEVHVPIGGRDRETITVSGEGNVYPDHAAGDVILQLRLSKHSTFKRQGADLGMNYSLSLKQALCGYKIKIEHVSGKTLVITPYDKNEIVQPGSLKIIHTMGLPQRFSPHIKGHLYIVMDVIMPISGSLKPKIIKEFKELLPNQNIKQKGDDDKDDDDDDDEGPDDEEKKQQTTNSNTNNKQKQPQHQQQQKKKNKQNKKKNQYRNKKNKNKNKKNKNKKNKGGGSGVFGGLQGAFGGGGGGGNKNKNQNNNKNDDKEPMDQDEEDEEELIEEVESHAVDGNPKATPASASNYYNEDEEDGDGVQCRQM